MGVFRRYPPPRQRGRFFLSAAAATVDLTVAVSTGDDDAQESSAGIVTLSGTATSVSSSAPRFMYILRGVNIPADATIVEAYAELWPTDSAQDSPNLTVRGQINPANLVATNENISTRTFTSAGVVWNAADVGTAAYKRSPNIAGVIQEIVDDPGWTQGDDIGIVLINIAGSFRVSTYNGNVSQAPRLYVKYSTGGGGAQTVPLNTLNLTASAVALTVAPGAVSPSLATLTAPLSAVQLNVSAVVGVLLSTLSGGATVDDLVVAPGGIALLIAELTAAAEVIDLTVVPGAMAAALNALSWAGSPVTLTMGRDGATITRGTLTAAGEAVDLTVIAGAVDVLLNVLTAVGGAVAVGVTPDGVTLTFNTFTLLTQALHLAVGQGIGLGTLTATSAAESLSVVPGAMAVLLATAAHVLSAVPFQITPGPVVIDVETLLAAIEVVAASVSGIGADVTVLIQVVTGLLAPVEIGVIPGDMLVPLQTMTPALSIEQLLVFMMLGCVLLGDRANYQNTVADFRRYLVTVADHGGCCE